MRDVSVKVSNVDGRRLDDIDIEMILIETEIDKIINRYSSKKRMAEKILDPWVGTSSSMDIREEANWS